MSNLPPESMPDWTDGELLLLRSAEDDRPPPRSVRATLAAVGVGGAALSIAATAQGTSAGAAVAVGKWGGAIAVWKWLGILLLGGAIAGTGVAVKRHVDATKRPTSSLISAPPKDATWPSGDEQAAASQHEQYSVAEPSSTAASVSQPVQTRSSGRKDKTAPSQPDITREIAAIDDARTALRQGKTAEALAALDRYDVEFTRGGSLHLEATALRIEALIQRGDRARATSLASAFLTSHSKSPYAMRIRALIGADATEP